MVSGPKAAAILVAAVVGCAVFGVLWLFDAGRPTAGAHGYEVSDVGAFVYFDEAYSLYRAGRNGEIHFYDRATDTSIIFLVSAMPSTGFGKVVENFETSMERLGEVEMVDRTRDRIDMRAVAFFRKVSQGAVFRGRNCADEPVVARVIFQYDRTSSPRDVWIDQRDALFPDVQFRHLCR